MAFPNFYNSSFNPLFRFLEDFDSHYSNKAARPHVIHREATPHWQPKFDVCETEQAYELYGDFPGVSKDNVHIKFSDPQTMIVHGNTKRSIRPDPTPADVADESTLNGSVAEDSDKHSVHYHKATVEDDFEDVSADVPAPPKEAAKPQAVKPEPKKTENTQPAKSKPAPEPKYWLTERPVGDFARSFHFPTRVDQSAVTANFKDGVLTIVVPKAKKHETRRIAVI